MSTKGTMDTRLITIDELANALRVKKSWVYNQTRQVGPHALPRLHVGKYLRFNLHAVMDWLERQNRDEV